MLFRFMKRFFATIIHEDKVLLSEEEAHHCIHVLRTQDKEEVEVIDGQGNLWLTEVDFINKKQVFLRIIRHLVQNELNPAKCSLAVAPTKNVDRIEWLLEKAVEIGLREFYPIITQRTERSRLRIDRLEKIAIGAMKQSLRLWKPVIHEPIAFEKFISETSHQDKKYIAYCGNEFEKIPLNQVRNEQALVVIGPEGDFSDTEISIAMKNGFVPVSLGDVRLRVETAALTACTLLNYS